MDILANISLADHAARAGGKLYINGAGWSDRAPNPGPWAIAIEVKVPWHDNNRTFAFNLELVDADGQPFEVDTPDGKQPFAFGGELKLTAGPHRKPGSQINGLIAVNLPPLALPAGETFEWKLSLDGEARDEWRATFGVLGRTQRRAA